MMGADLRSAPGQSQLMQVRRREPGSGSLTLKLAKKGDFVGAKTAFKKVEEQCAACHAKFRD
jgi:hypothetical protein